MKTFSEILKDFLKTESKIDMIMVDKKTGSETKTLIYNGKEYTPIVIDPSGAVIKLNGKEEYIPVNKLNVEIGIRKEGKDGNGN